MPLDKDSDTRIVSEYPQIKALDAPSNCPDNVARIFIEAQDNARRSNWDSAGMGARRTLELATRKLREGDKKFADETLWKRIDILASDHDITPAMREWADAIRLDGNEANHDDDAFDENKAKALISFTETFLLYAFTLPAMVEARKPEPE